MKIYFAHCVAIYGTPQEQRDLATLRALGFEVLDPNDEAIDKAIQAEKDAGREYMQIFRDIVQSCDAFAFRALPDGRIPAGVAKEIGYAREKGMPIVELPSGVTARAISLEETREYLHEVGER